MSNALFLGWDRPVSGKEAFALELFATTIKYLDRKKKDGFVESYEPVIVGAHGGELNGFWLIKGKPEKLAIMRGEDEFLRLITKANIALKGLGVVDAYVGDELARLMKIYGESI